MIYKNIFTGADLEGGGQKLFINFEVKKPAEKGNFLVKIFQKVPKQALLGLFFHNFACGGKFLAKNIFSARRSFWENSKIVLNDLKNP